MYDLVDTPLADCFRRFAAQASMTQHEIILSKSSQKWHVQNRATSASAIHERHHTITIKLHDIIRKPSVYHSSVNEKCCVTTESEMCNGKD